MKKFTKAQEIALTLIERRILELKLDLSKLEATKRRILKEAGIEFNDTQKL